MRCFNWSAISRVALRCTLLFGMATPAALAAAPLNLRDLVDPGRHDHRVGHVHDAGAVQKLRRSIESVQAMPNIDVQHYDIQIEVDPIGGRINGRVGIDLVSRTQALRAVDLNALGMDIRRVTTATGSALRFTYDGAMLRVSLPDPLALNSRTNVVVHYSANMPQTLNLTGPDVSDPERMPAAYTFTQPDGTREWFPGHDVPGDKATMGIEVTVPRGFKVLSNGHLLVSREAFDRSVWQYRMEEPIATYLISLAIGPYAVDRIGSHRGRDLFVWSPPNLRTAMLHDTANTRAMMEVFSAFTGTEYPFDLYSQSVAEAWRSSMEHQTATTMGGTRITGDRSGESVVAHELAHQWFGNILTCAHWGELWLNEGFASYLPYVWLSSRAETSLSARTSAMAQIDWWRPGYFEEAREKARPLSMAEPGEDDLFDSHSYEKGALVIRLMREVANTMAISELGPTSSNPLAVEPFSHALAIYQRRHRGENVTNLDLEKALSDATGTSWTKFFDQWVRAPGHPVLAASYTWADGITTLRVEQTQVTRSERPWGMFSFPLDVEQIFADGTSRVLRVNVDATRSEFTLPAATPPVALQLDPRLIVPAEINVEQGGNAWLSIVRSSNVEWSRVTAAREWLKRNDGIATVAFINAVKSDRSLYLRLAVLDALSAKPENRDLFITLRQSIVMPAAPDTYTTGAIARADAWIIETGNQTFTDADERRWQARYTQSDVVAERTASLRVLTRISRIRAQTFALQQLDASHRVSADQGALIDVISSSWSEPSLAFAREFLVVGTERWQARVLSALNAMPATQPSSTASDGSPVATLTGDQLADQPTLVDSLILAARRNLDFGVRAAATTALGKQVSSREMVCPVLQELKTVRAGLPADDRLAGVNAAAIKASQLLVCETQ